MTNVQKINYSVLPYGSKVIVFGIGKVGRQYVRSINHTKRLELVAIIDNKMKGSYYAGKKIVSAEAIKELRFDYVIIATEDSGLALEMRQELVNHGIPDTKVIWNGEEHNQKFREYYEYEKFLERNLTDGLKRMYIFMTPEHGNAGDYAITYSEVEFLKKFFPEYRIFTVTTNEWRNAKNEIIGLIGLDDIVFLNGGGFIGDLWDGDIDDYHSIIEAFPKNHVIFFPNTLSFRNYGEEVDAEIQWLDNHRNVYVLLRDQNSYEMYRKHSSRCALFPDMVFYFGTCEKRFLLNDIILGTAENDKILLCLRDDHERQEGISEKITASLNEEAIPFDELNISAGYYISLDEGYEYVKHICSEMRKYRCVITDRLHGMIFAVISDVPCIAIDNTTHKVNGAARWISGKSYLTLYEDCCENSIDDLILNCIDSKNKAGTFTFPSSFYNDMANCIRSFIGENI